VVLALILAGLIGAALATVVVHLWPQLMNWTLAQLLPWADANRPDHQRPAGPRSAAGPDRSLTASRRRGPRVTGISAAGPPRDDRFEQGAGVGRQPAGPRRAARVREDLLVDRVGFGAGGARSLP
jgi:hypothetical protein